MNLVSHKIDRRVDYFFNISDNLPKMKGGSDKLVWPWHEMLLLSLYKNSFDCYLELLEMFACQMLSYLGGSI